MRIFMRMFITELEVKCVYFEYFSKMLKMPFQTKGNVG